jgi:beta-glucanase (GH16 family)
MRSSILSASAAILLSGLASAQTFTDCNPTEKSGCPADPALGGRQVTDFTAGKSDNWELADGTTLSYDNSLGAEFVISTKTNAPTISNTKYIFFGSIEVFARASPGTGIVSSFILESDDLDEIDWEWLGAYNNKVENNFFGKGNTTNYNRAEYPPVTTPIDTFHNYTIDWTQERIIWYIDGAAVRTLAYSDDLALNGKNYPQTPMRVKMGSWVGCADQAAATNPATQGTCEWAGGAADFSKGPFTFYVKNVTIQDYGCATEYTYGDLTGSYQSIKSSGGCSGGSSKSSSSSSSSSSSPSSASSTGSSTATSSGSASKSTSGSTTLSTTAKSTATLSPSNNSTSTASISGLVAAASGTATATASSTLAQSTTSGATALKPKHEYGILDISVMVLGLGLGYLVM